MCWRTVQLNFSHMSLDRMKSGSTSQLIESKGSAGDGTSIGATCITDFYVTTSQARGHTPSFLHVNSAHVPYRPAPYRESTRKPRGRSRRPPIRPDWLAFIDARTREIQRLLFRDYKSSTRPHTRFFACGLGSCTPQTCPIPREHQKTAWGDQESDLA